MTNPFQFTGRENDGNAVYFFRSRYYSSSLSRFLAEDPGGLEAGMNLYDYARNNPLIFVDPFGLQAACPRPTETDCRVEFFKCLGQEVLAPGWSTAAIGAGEAAGAYYGARAYQHAASRTLSYPLRSSIVRGALSVSRTAGPGSILVSVIIAEGICLLREIECVNSQ